MAKANGIVSRMRKISIPSPIFLDPDAERALIRFCFFAKYETLRKAGKRRRKLTVTP
jgi:hypothetical protein